MADIPNRLPLLALAQYNEVNQRFYVAQQLDYERSLIHKIKESPKLLHQYIRSKKIGTPSVGPLKLDNGELTSNCGEMAEIFAASFLQSGVCNPGT